MINSDLVAAKCKKSEPVVGAGAFWSFQNFADDNTDDPGKAPAQTQSLKIAKRSVTGEGGSDTNADTSTFTVQAACLGKKK